MLIINSTYKTAILMVEIRSNVDISVEVSLSSLDDEGTVYIVLVVA